MGSIVSKSYGFWRRFYSISRRHSSSMHSHFGGIGHSSSVQVASAIALHLYSWKDRMTGFMLKPRKNSWKPTSSGGNPWSGIKPTASIMSLPMIWAYRCRSFILVNFDVVFMPNRSGKSMSKWDPSERTWAWTFAVARSVTVCTFSKAILRPKLVASYFAKRREGISGRMEVTSGTSTGVRDKATCLLLLMLLLS